MSEYVVINNSDNELYHYGVLGMKWGVHRAQKYASAGRIERLQRKNAKYAAKAAKYAAKAEKHMSKGADTYLNNLVRGHAFTKQHREKAARRMANATHYRMKADAVKAKLEKEAAYVQKMKTKVSAIPKAELDAGYAFCKDFLNDR